MEDLKRANAMERVLRDVRGEGDSVATMAKRYSLSEESINTVLGIKPEAKETPKHSLSVIDRIIKRLGF